MEQKEIKRILKKYKEMFEALETYDETGKLRKLKCKKLREKTGKPISRLIEERI